MKVNKLEIGKNYYHGNCKKKFKCVELNTNIDENQSDFVDYKKTLHRFYNDDMYLNKQM